MIEHPENHDAAKTIIEAFGFDDATVLIDGAREQARERFGRDPDISRVDVPITKSDGDGRNGHRVATLSFSRS